LDFLQGHQPVREGFSLDGRRVGLTFLLAGLLFFFAYSCEQILEQIFLVDSRFLFPFASDLTRERAWMFVSSQVIAPLPI
jgi:hypothetical protein